MNWLKSIFNREPKRSSYVVYWSEVHEVSDIRYLEGIGECEFGFTRIISHSAAYDAESSQQAMAMHRSDYPGTQITSIISWS